MAEYFKISGTHDSSLPYLGSFIYLGELGKRVRVLGSGSICIDLCRDQGKQGNHQVIYLESHLASLHCQHF